MQLLITYFWKQLSVTTQLASAMVVNHCDMTGSNYMILNGAMIVNRQPVFLHWKCTFLNRWCWPYLVSLWPWPLTILTSKSKHFIFITNCTWVVSFVNFHKCFVRHRDHKCSVCDHTLMHTRIQYMQMDSPKMECLQWLMESPIGTTYELSSVANHWQKHK